MRSSADSDYRESRATIDQPHRAADDARNAAESDYREARATIDTPQREADDLRSRADSARRVADDPSAAVAERAKREVTERTDDGKSKLDDAVDELDPSKKV